MPLSSGARVGPYEILSAIGAGGMGQVYRARDTKLSREVALKVLPDSFANDPDRLARFEREAHVLASLNHPNIAHIHGFEESGGVRALAMELVDGEDLAQRLARGAIPIDEALTISKQIAEALEAAHEHGIIHRDLKPANIKVRPDGTVKVLDFGLAKALDPLASSPDVSQSPTITTPAMTQAGMILGTAAYMAPEQARGLPLDKRADLWAFGCVLYEMLTGRRAFEGEDVTVTLANIVRGEPAWNALPAGTPTSIRRLLRRCLAKDPKHRLRDASGAILEIDDARAGIEEGTTVAAPVRTWRRLAVSAALIVLGMVVAGAAAWRLARKPEAPAQVVRFSIPLEDGAVYTFPGRHIVALSPDGSRLAFVANGRIYLRALNETSATAIRGTEIGGGRSPFFSPDGQWLGFWADGALKKVAISGGAPVVLCQANNPWGASWSADGNILVGQGPGGVWQVPGNGGAPATLLKVKEGELAQSPQRLPGGDWVLLTVRPAGASDWNQAQIVVQSIATGERRVLINGGRDARYLSTGHLVYALNGVLYAVRFDARSNQVLGGPVSLVEGVSDAGGTSGAAHYSIAANGSLVYVGGLLAPASSRGLVWVDRAGHDEPLKFDAGPYSYPRISPDGSRVAVAITRTAALGSDIWVLDLERGSRTRITFEGNNNQYYPVWMRDGTQLIFSDANSQKNRVLRAPASGAGSAETLLEGEERYPTSLSPDGRVLAFYQLQPKTLRDLWVLPLDGQGKPVQFFASPFEDSAPVFSPDGRWLAFESNKSSRSEVYVRPYPAAGAQEYTISTDGGTEPVWGPGGHELFYRHGNELMSVAITVTAGSLVAARPVRLFTGQFVLDGSATQTVANYDISHDGKRFLMLKPSTQGGQTVPPMSVVLNWLEELKARVPTN